MTLYPLRKSHCFGEGIEKIPLIVDKLIFRKF